MDPFLNLSSLLLILWCWMCSSHGVVSQPLVIGVSALPSASSFQRMELLLEDCVPPPPPSSPFLLWVLLLAPSLREL